MEVDQNGIIDSMLVTSANVHDTTMFTALLEQSELSAGDIVYADKGYHSEANKEFLKHRNLTDKIMHKRKRNEPEDEEIKQRNKAISQTRSIIERVFGTLKRSYGWARTRYIGLPKTAAYLLIRGLAYNLKRAEKILSLTPL